VKNAIPAAIYSVISLFIFTLHYQKNSCGGIGVKLRECEVNWGNERCE
jgi:hypothetical protein